METWSKICVVKNHAATNVGGKETFIDALTFHVDCALMIIMVNYDKFWCVCANKRGYKNMHSHK
jgi:hypothetical protein